VSTRERYGRSPAMLAWPAIMTLQEEKKTVLRAGQLDVHPADMLSEEGALEPFSLRPGALNPGLVNDQGQALALPFKTGANVPLGLELMGIEKQDIEDAFLTSVFKVLAENPQMTATQVLEIAQQRGVLLAPTMGRQHSEDLGRSSSARSTSPRRRASCRRCRPSSRRSAASTTSSTPHRSRAPCAPRMRSPSRARFELLPAAIAIDKNAAYVLDVSEAVRTVAEINGVPAKLIRDKKTVDQIVAQNAQAERPPRRLPPRPRSPRPRSTPRRPKTCEASRSEKRLMADTKDSLRKKRKAYLDTFCGDFAKPHPAGAAVLADLKRFCGISKPGWW
jgi:hypothetical protein